MSTIDIKDMANASVHCGHKTQKWNPRMRKYIYGDKNGIHIFDLNASKQAFENALDFLAKSAKEGKRVLLVSTKPQSTQQVIAASEKAGVDYVVRKWIPGLLTNFETLKKRINHLRDLKKMKETGEMEKYTKKEIVKMNKEIEKLEAALGGVQEMKKLPEVVVVFDVVRDDIAVLEAKKLGVPVVGICDSNANPEVVDYPIPGNDDAVKSISFYLDSIVAALTSGKK